MKLLDLLYQFHEGMGQGVVSRGRSSGRRPVRLYDPAPRRMLGQVAKVIVETWDTGPFATDICWLLTDAEDRILFVLPTGAVAGETLLKRIGDRPGFDRTALRRAMRSTRNARFTVWQRDRIAGR